MRKIYIFFRLVTSATDKQTHIGENITSFFRWKKRTSTKEADLRLAFNCLCITYKHINCYSKNCPSCNVNCQTHQSFFSITKQIISWRHCQLPIR